MVPWAHKGLIIENHAFTGAHCGGGAGEISENEESLTPHVLALGGDNVDDLAIGGEQCI